MKRTYSRTRGLQICCSWAALVLSTLLPAAASAAENLNSNEWPYWRGPQNTGASLAKGLPSKWTSETDGVLWKAEVGGRSTPVIFKDRVFMIHITGDGPSMKEETVCLDAHTGKILWRHAFDIFHTDVPMDRVGWTSPVVDTETGNVYVHGVQGLFYCYDRDGKILWSRSFTEEVGRISGFGGRTQSPMIDNDLVIISFMNSGLGEQGRAMHRYLAMDKKTGEVIWWSTPKEPPLDTNFSVPVVMEVNGTRLLVGGNGNGWVEAIKAETGQNVWSFELSKRGLNVSVVVEGNKVYAMHSEDNIDLNTMGRIVCIDATGKGDVTKTNEVWRYDAIDVGYSSPILQGGRLYCVDNSANMVCLDANTGKEYWKKSFGKVGWGSPIWGDGKIYFPEVNGEFFIIQPKENDAEILSTIKFSRPDRTVVDTRGCPAIAYGRLYMMSRDAFYCVGNKEIPKAVAIPSVPGTPVKGEGKPSFIQVLPAEVLIEKDAKPKFRARLFDAKGRLIGDASDVTWGVKALKGTLDGKSATFTPDASLNGQFGVVTALVKTEDGQLTNSARVRVLPELPIAEDFEAIPEKETPKHWIGASAVKFEVATVDGTKALRKKSDNPQFSRGDIYLGSPTMKNYTIQADVRPTMKRRNMPDIGLINSRYEFGLRGNEENVRLIAWIPMPRVIKTIPFVPEPDVWYTMKTTVDYKDGKATVRGKIWKRDEKEPEAWTIEMEDPYPYLEGSPGLSSFAMADAYFDNVKVTPNETE